MPGIGVAKPQYAKYTNTSGVISYSDGGTLAEVVDFNAEIKVAEGNDFWSDNHISETDRSFESGSFTMNTNGLTQAASAAIMGITPSDVTVGVDTVSELIYNDDMTSPALGLGIIEKHKLNGVVSYRAIMFPKVQFNIPKSAAKTYQGKIEWQAKELSGIILRDDSSKHAWMHEAECATEEAALAYLQELLSITPAA